MQFFPAKYIKTPATKHVLERGREEAFMKLAEEGVWMANCSHVDFISIT